MEDYSLERRIVQGVYYVDVWGYDHRDFVDVIHLIKHRKIYKLVLLMPSEYYFQPYFNNKQSFEIFLGFCNYHNVRVECLIGNNISTNFGYKHDLIEFTDNLTTWETWFAFQVVNHAIQHRLDPYEINPNPSKHFVSMNGRGHPHRLMFLDYMNKEKLFDYGYVSFHNFENKPYDSYTFKWWSPEILKFDEEHEPGPDGMIDILRPPQQFKDSVFSVICESTTEVQFITEKTYIPIYHRRPFVIYGHPLANAYMKSLGFEIFDDLIDYSFDEIDDDELRCDMFMQQIKKLTSYDTKYLRDAVQSKVHHNWLNMLSIVENKKTKKRVKRLLPSHSNHFHIINHLEHLNISYSDQYQHKINFLKEHYENTINRK
jgi:Txe/YoeB family toxin of Txe-Axe toxin-antitoxin module